MRSKKQIKSIHADDNQPATKGDVREAVNELAEVTSNAFATELKPIRSDIAELKEDVSTLKAGQARLERSQEAILDVVKSIDQQLREHKSHPDRLTRLERSVFRR